MTKRVLLVSGLALVFAVTAAFTAVPGRTADPVDSKLEQYMKEINSTARKLRGALKDPEKNAASIVDVRAMQVLAIKSRDEVPSMAKDIKEEERAEWIAEYQRQMVEFTRSLLDLEISLIDGDNEGAQKQLVELNGAKSEAHKKFKAPDKEGGGERGERGEGGERAPQGRRRGE